MQITSLPAVVATSEITVALRVSEGSDPKGVAAALDPSAVVGNFLSISIEIFDTARTVEISGRVDQVAALVSAGQDLGFFPAD